MAGYQFHEALYRKAEVMTRLRDQSILVCGAGALGANLAESLARMGCQRLQVLDRDRVEERNLSTQPYYRADVGAHKAKILAHALFRAVGAKVGAHCLELEASNVARVLEGRPLVVDCFDNSASRGLLHSHCSQHSLDCLHAGMAADYAEVIWNQDYRVPSPAQDDLCDYPLARNLVTLTVGVACEALVAFLATGERRSYTLTLADLVISPYG